MRDEISSSKLREVEIYIFRLFRFWLNIDDVSQVFSIFINIKNLDIV